jgi:tyrosine aminotransferase
LKSLIDENTRAILVNNPSNPCGSSFSREHMLEIVQVANDFRLPIISDEVYYDMVYEEGKPFYSFGNITHDVPIMVSLPLK